MRTLYDPQLFAVFEKHYRRLFAIREVNAPHRGQFSLRSIADAVNSAQSLGGDFLNDVFNMEHFGDLNLDVSQLVGHAGTVCGFGA